MKRDLSALASRRHDVLIVGGGIYGACALWDAAHRGLKAALIEKGDFGGATSSNSMKTVHGGLRYLQDFDLPLMRTMIKERRAWMTIAPHLVQPLRMLFPTDGRGRHSRGVLSVALRVTDLVGYDRNRDLGKNSHLPRSTMLTRDEVLSQLPGLQSSTKITGAAVWYDAQVLNTEQMLLSILKSAVQRGAILANYVRAESILLEGQSAVGARARDLESSQRFDIHARFVVNATGPWVEQMLSSTGRRRPRFKLSRAVNIVVPKIIDGVGVGLRSCVQMKGDLSRPRSGKTIFIVPWRDWSIIGTMHGAPVDRPEHVGPIEPEIERLISGVNEVYPGANLDRSSVSMVHTGLQPLDPRRVDRGRPELLRESELADHESDLGIRNLISLIGAKYTSARWLAERAIDLVAHRLDIPVPPSRTGSIPVHGGQITSLEDETSALQARFSFLSESVIRQLAQAYGSEAERVLAYAQDDLSKLQAIAGQSSVLRCQIYYAIQEEMARRPSDVVLRRTDIGSAGPPSQSTLQEIQDIMAQVLGWRSLSSDVENEDSVPLAELP
ncbi:MAG: glycerol-3-phosphate dehydrogenase/oxidase [Anaerolineales bacterium]